MSVDIVLFYFSCGMKDHEIASSGLSLNHTIFKHISRKVKSLEY